MALKSRIQGKKEVEEINNGQKDVKETVSKQETKKEVTDYAKKIDKVYAQMKKGDCFFEILEDGFNLLKENKGYETKVHINMTQLDVNKKQKQFLTHYLDITNFLFLRYLFNSGKVFELEEEERSKGKQYLGAIWSEFKKPDGVDANTLSLIPGMVKGNWMLQISEKKDGKVQSVSVPIKTERLVGTLELIYLAYQKHLMQMN